MKKGMKIVRFIGIVCWFLALFILINGHQEKKKAAEEAAKQPAIVTETKETNDGATPSTVIFPEEKRKRSQMEYPKENAFLCFRLKVLKSLRRF